MQAALHGLFESPGPLVSDKMEVLVLVLRGRIRHNLTLRVVLLEGTDRYNIHPLSNREPPVDDTGKSLHVSGWPSEASS